MADNPLVFGISDGMFDGPYTFLHVLGIVIDDRVQHVANPTEEFPDRGTVFLPEEFWIPPEGQAAVWRVAPNPSADHTAQYNVIAKGRAGPLEILPIPHPSSDPERVRTALVEGISLPYVPDNQALFELRDGVVIGPIGADLTRAPNLRGFFCPEDAFRDPLGRWEDVSELQPLKVVHHGKQRCFSSFMELPPAPGSYDLEDFQTKVELVLRFLAREGLIELTRAEIDAVSDLLRDAGVPNRVASRANEVLATLSEAILTRDQVSRVVDALKHTSQIKAELDNERAAAREEALALLETERTDLYSAVEELRAERGRLERDVADTREEIERAAAAIGNAIEERVKQAQEDASDLLATVTVLRPFLQVGLTNAGTAIKSEAIPSPDSVTAPADLDAACAALTANLETIGIRSASSAALSAQIFAAALAGQPTIFSGSFAPLVARTCARALAADSSHCIRIPAGLLDGREIEQELVRVEESVQSTGSVSSIILEGLNRSSFEVYAGGFQQRAIESAILRMPSDGVLCFGTIATGPGALPPSRALTEIAPIFDVDCLLMGRPTAGAQVEGGRISASHWTEWSRATTEAIAPQRPELLEILGAGRTTAVWASVLERSLAALSALVPEERTGSPLALLCFGWVVPAALTLDADDPDRDALLAAVRAEVDGLDRDDGALQRLLDRVAPAESNR